MSGHGGSYAHRADRWWQSVTSSSRTPDCRARCAARPSPARNGHRSHRGRGVGGSSPRQVQRWIDAAARQAYELVKFEGPCPDDLVERFSTFFG